MNKQDKIKALILEHIDFDGYEEKYFTVEPSTDWGRIQLAGDIFRSEMGGQSYQLARDWFQGLCSVCTVPFWNNEIEDMGFNPDTYWDDLAEVFIDMIDGRV